MALFKPVIQKKRDDGLALVYIRCTHNRKISYIKTDMYVPIRSVDAKGNIKDNDILRKCLNIISEWNEVLNKEDTKNWVVQDIVKFLQQGDSGISFMDYSKIFIHNLEKLDKSVSASNYSVALKSFSNFFGEKITFQEMTSKKLNSWIDDLRETARAKQMYPSHIKTIFEAGCLEYNDYDRNIIRIQNQPFKTVKIPKSDTPAKRSVDAEVLRKIFEVTPDTKIAGLAQDVAKLILYLVGINTIDLFSIKKKDKYRKVEYISYDGDILRYKRSKTTRRKDEAYIEVKVSDEIKPIFEKYKSDSEALFKWGYRDFRGFNKYVNKGLKRLATLAGVDPIDTYTFRHSWATIAQNKCGASTELVGFCLNHVSAHRITEGYIEKDYTPIDRMNEKVINYIFQQGEYKKTEAD